MKLSTEMSLQTLEHSRTCHVLAKQDINPDNQWEVGFFFSLWIYKAYFVTTKEFH